MSRFISLTFFIKVWWPTEITRLTLNYLFSFIVEWIAFYFFILFFIYFHFFCSSFVKMKKALLIPLFLLIHSRTGDKRDESKSHFLLRDRDSSHVTLDFYTLIEFIFIITFKIFYFLPIKTSPFKYVLPAVVQWLANTLFSI